jgi:hypothetical protein
MGTPFSSKDLSSPMWLKPQADPPPKTRATVGFEPAEAEVLVGKTENKVSKIRATQVCFTS